MTNQTYIYIIKLF